MSGKTYIEKRNLLKTLPENAIIPVKVKGVENDSSFNELEDGYILLQNFATGTPPYKVYTALLTQSGTDAPVATVLENTLGGEVSLSRTSTGKYALTKTAAFTSSKTFVLISAGNPAAGTFLMYNINDVDSVAIFNYDSSSSDTVDEFVNASIEIRVYP